MQTKETLRFVVLIGVVSLFGDMTYEAARSLNGPYLAHLGASAVAVGIIAGLGEFIGYGLRLVSGRIFDRMGIFTLVIGACFSLFFAPLVFLGGWKAAILGMAFWGVGMGAQESVMRAAIAELVPMDRRGSAYGIFNMGYGLFWFLGSALMGILYDLSIGALVAFSVTMQLFSIPILLRAAFYTRPYLPSGRL
jgi:MFS family permease